MHGASPLLGTDWRALATMWRVIAAGAEPGCGDATACASRSMTRLPPGARASGLPASVAPVMLLWRDRRPTLPPRFRPSPMPPCTAGDSLARAKAQLPEGSDHLASSGRRRDHLLVTFSRLFWVIFSYKSIG